MILHRWLKIRSFIRHGDLKSNVDALIGKRVTVVKDIAAQGTGYVKIDGEQWLARTIDGSAVPAGTTVEVAMARGAHLLVKRI